MEFLAEPETWVAVGFVMVIGILLYVGVPKMVATMLDARAAGIKAELDEARRLREEAAALLAGYQKKAAEAEREARGHRGCRHRRSGAVPEGIPLPHWAARSPAARPAPRTRSHKRKPPRSTRFAPWPPIPP